MGNTDSQFLQELRSGEFEFPRPYGKLLWRLFVTADSLREEDVITIRSAEQIRYCNAAREFNLHGIKRLEVRVDGKLADSRLCICPSKLLPDAEKFRKKSA